MSDEIGKAIKAALVKVGERIRDKAIDEAPYRTGLLKKSITVHDEYDDKVIVSAGDGHAPYAVYVHEGTKPHIIRPKNKKVLANKKAGIVFGKKVMHPGIKPNPYLLRAAEKTAPEIERLIAKDVGEAVARELERQLRGIKAEQ